VRLKQAERSRWAWSSLLSAGICFRWSGADVSYTCNWAFWPGMFMYVTTVAALLYTSIYNAIWKGIITAEGQTAGFLVGNIITAAFGLYMVVAAALLFVDGVKAFNQAKLGVAPASAGD